MPQASVPLSVRAGSFIGSFIDSSVSLVARQKHDVVRFAMGAPSDDLMPVELLDRVAARASAGKYGYGNTEGEPELVEEILRLPHQQPVLSPERIVVTTGGMQGLDLAFKLIVDRGDLVISEGPTFTNTYATALSYGADIHEAPLDEHGMVVEQLPEIVARLGRTPKAIYTIPNFQNPSGATLSLERRRLLLELAERWGSMIIDDDPYAMMRFAGEPVPSFAELSPGNPLVFSVRTFSKILAPGLRLGWVDTDPSLRPLLEHAKQAMDTCTSVPIQRAAADFLAEGLLPGHLDRVLRLYRERKDAMVGALDRHFGSAVRATNPDGGFFLWVTFVDEAIDTGKLFEPALAEGVAFIPGHAFTLSGGLRNALRLCFATSTPERIETGIGRLRAAVERTFGGL